MTMGIFLLINLTKMIDLTINKIGNIIKLVNDLFNKTTQSSQIGKCLTR
jgi:hypothetical protein